MWTDVCFVYKHVHCVCGSSPQRTENCIKNPGTRFLGSSSFPKCVGNWIHLPMSYWQLGFWKSTISEGFPFYMIFTVGLCTEERIFHNDLWRHWIRNPPNSQLFECLGTTESDTIWKDSMCGLLKDVCHWGWTLRIQKSMPIPEFLSLSICLSVCLSIYLSIHISVFFSSCLQIRL